MLISHEAIAKRVAEMGAEITRDFVGQPVILVGVLKGSAIFLADLARQIKLDATFDFIGVSSYGNRPSPTQELKSGWDSTGEVKLTKDVDQSMKDKNFMFAVKCRFAIDAIATVYRAEPPRFEHAGADKMVWALLSISATTRATASAFANPT